MIIIEIYHVAQICKNGHIVTEFADEDIFQREKYCSKCGAETIMECPNCAKPIRGNCGPYFEYHLPKYCFNCGVPYPWTKDKIDATKELIQLELKLSDKDVLALSNDLYSLVTDTPRTQVAAVKFKSTLTRVGPVVAQGAKDLLVDIIAESAKRIIWGY